VVRYDDEDRIFLSLKRTKNRKEKLLSVYFPVQMILIVNVSVGPEGKLDGVLNFENFLQPALRLS
jgi:hypothetical protein